MIFINWISITSLFFLVIIIIKVLPFLQKGKLCKENYLWYFSLNINSPGIKCTHGDELIFINWVSVLKRTIFNLKLIKHLYNKLGLICKDFCAWIITREVYIHVLITMCAFNAWWIYIQTEIPHAWINSSEPVLNVHRVWRPPLNFVSVLECT
jgi:hypothetical protein